MSEASTKGPNIVSGRSHSEGVLKPASPWTAIRVMKVFIVVVIGGLVSISIIFSLASISSPNDDDFGDGTVRSQSSVHGRDRVEQKAERIRNSILMEAMERVRNSSTGKEETDDAPNEFPVVARNISVIKAPVVGEFSCAAYVVVHYQLDKRMKADPHYCWTHFKTKGFPKKMNMAVETQDGRFFEGQFSPVDYYALNGAKASGVSAWEHYVRTGHAERYKVTLKNPNEVVLPGGEMEIGQFLSRKYPNKPRVMLLTHAWGGGTETFEDQLTNFPMFEFIFVRVRYQSTRSISIALMKNSTRTRYLTEWFEVTSSSIAKVLDSIDADLILIHFLHPYLEVLGYLKTLNKPMVYIMHDHHLVAFDHNSDMHLTCSVTDSFNITNYAQPGARDYELFQDRLAATPFDHIEYYKNWKVWRWEAAELLRRCVAVVTPSARNKQLFSIFFPEVYVSSAPLVRPSTSVCDVKTSVTPLRAGEALRIVILGAVSIGKGARIAERIAYEGTLANSWKVYHIGGGFHYTAQAFTRIISKGRYNDTAHALKMIDEVNPHLIWFPAIRHESFCFMLDVALYSKYPIAASTTGSFPERISGRPNTWLLDGCLGYEEWMEFFHAYIRHQPKTQVRGASVLSAKKQSSVQLRFLDHYPQDPSSKCASPSYDFEDMGSFLRSLRGFYDTYKRSTVGIPPLRQALVRSIPLVRGTLRDEGNTDEWLEFLALNPRLILEKGSVENAKEHALRVMYGSWDGFAMINRFSLNPIFFKDRNHYAPNPLVGPPYSDKADVADTSQVLFNKLQWVAPSSLLIVWEYLAKNVPVYTSWYKTAFPVTNTSTSNPKMTSKTSSWAVPIDGRKHKNAAIMLDPRYSEMGFAIAMNVMYHLDEGWSLYIYCSASAAERYRVEFAEYPVNIIEIVDESLHSMFKVSKWLLDIDLWKQLQLAGAQNALVFQADSLLFRGHGYVDPSTHPVVAGHKAPVLRSVNEYIAAGFAFIGAYGPGVGSDHRTPKGVGLNGGLSLRNVAAILDCLERVPYEAVNKYRVDYGMEAVPHNPSKGIYIPEDIYYYHALEMLGYRLPSIDYASQFAVQSAFQLPPGSGALMVEHSSPAAIERDKIGRTGSTKPLGIHGFDKGWYLTTAQLAALVND